MRIEPKGDPWEGLDLFLYRIQNPTRSEQAQIGRSVRREFAHTFSRQRSNAPWPPLAESTVQDRIRQGFPGRSPKLIRTGDYMRSWVEAGDGDHVERFERTSSGWVLEVGSADYRSIWHEFGTRKMPARPIADMPPQSENAIMDTVDAIFERLWSA